MRPGTVQFHLITLSGVCSFVRGEEKCCVLLEIRISGNLLNSTGPERNYEDAMTLPFVNRLSSVWINLLTLEFSD